MISIEKIHRYMVAIFLLLSAFILFGDTGKVKIISPERPLIKYYSRTYLEYANLTISRINRRNPIYYGNAHVKTLATVGNNVSLTLYFYVLTGNHKYQRTYLDFNYKLCDCFEKDNFVGDIVREKLKNHHCPFPPGEYHLTNLTMRQDSLPAIIPAVRGRVELNFTVAPNEVIFYGTLDIEVREVEENYVKGMHK